MGLFDTSATFQIAHASVSIRPCTPKTETMTFINVRPGDVLEIPYDNGVIMDLKAYGAVRRLGPKRCQCDESTGLVQVRKPPASGIVRVKWESHAPWTKVGQASGILITETTTHTTYKDRHNG